MATVTKAWEDAAAEAADVTRVVCLRIGVVLDPQDGALAKLLLPMKLFVGGVLGSGRQMFPWVHRDDVVMAFLWAAENASAHGPYNVVSPHCVSMAEFVHTLGHVMHRPTLFPVPGGALRLLLGKQADMVLHSHYIVPTRLMGSSFRFAYPDLNQALRNLLSR